MIYDTLNDLKTDLTNYLGGRATVRYANTWLKIARQWIETGKTVSSSGNRPALTVPPLRISELEAVTTWDPLIEGGLPFPEDFSAVREMRGQTEGGRLVTLDFIPVNQFLDVSPTNNFVRPRAGYTSRQGKFVLSAIVRAPVTLDYWQKVPAFEDATWATNPVAQADAMVVLYAMLACAHRQFRNNDEFLATLGDLKAAIESLNAAAWREMQGQSPARPVIVGGVP